MTGRAQAKVFKDVFKKNEASEGSSLYFIDTSTETPFEINGAKFEENSATSSTIMLIKSDGSIENSQFIDNKATSQTQNIFLSMSEVNIVRSRF